MDKDGDEYIDAESMTNFQVAGTLNPEEGLPSFQLVGTVNPGP